jgi:hypothetical protein
LGEIKEAINAMRDTNKFNTDDWVEIVEALGSKIREIQSGRLGEEDYPGQDKEWIAHLRRIIRKIEGNPRPKTNPTKGGG